MAPGPPNLGDNRFAPLLDNTLTSPVPKKKRSANTTLTSFPELTPAKTRDPKFIVISASNPNESLDKFSCFAIHRSLKVISNEIVSISTPLVNNMGVAKKFLNTKQLAGLCQITCKLHDKLNTSRGTIYAPYLANVPEDEIVQELKSQGVVSVYKFNRIVDGSQRFSGVLLLDFNLYTLPNKIDVSWHSVYVKEYIPSPMRCRNCQLLGHTIKHCKNPASCVGCNLPPHDTVECSRTSCANCAQNHPSNFSDCPKFVQQKQILTIKTRSKCSYKEAIKIHKQQLPTPPSITSYSSILKKPTENNNNTKKNNNINTFTTLKNINVTETKESTNTAAMNNSTIRNKNNDKINTNNTQSSTTTTLITKNFVQPDNHIIEMDPTNNKTTSYRSQSPLTLSSKTEEAMTSYINNSLTTPTNTVTNSKKHEMHNSLHNSQSNTLEPTDLESTDYAQILNKQDSHYNLRSSTH